MRRLALAAALMALPAAGQAQGGLATGAEVRAGVAALAVEARDGRAFHYRPVLKDGKTVAALEYWTAPGRPAVHPDEAEYAIVVDGAGTLLSGGTMADAKETRPGLVEGSRIVGGTSRALGVGDVILVPAGVPHSFGITGGKLVLLGLKLPGGGK